MRELAKFAHLGMMFPVSITLGVLAGYLLDRWLNTWPILALVGFGLGVAAAVAELFRAVARAER